MIDGTHFKDTNCVHHYICQGCTEAIKEIYYKYTPKSNILNSTQLASAKCFFCEANYNFCCYCYIFDNENLIKCSHNDELCNKYFHTSCFELNKFYESENKYDFNSYFDQLNYKLNDSLIWELGDIIKLLKNETNTLKLLKHSNNPIFKSFIAQIKLKSLNESYILNNSINNLSIGADVGVGCIDHTCCYCYSTLNLDEHNCRRKTLNYSFEASVIEDRLVSNRFLSIILQVFECLSNVFFLNLNENRNKEDDKDGTRSCVDIERVSEFIFPNNDEYRELSNEERESVLSSFKLISENTRKVSKKFKQSEDVVYLDYCTCFAKIKDMFLNSEKNSIRNRNSSYSERKEKIVFSSKESLLNNKEFINFAVNFKVNSLVSIWNV